MPDKPAPHLYITLFGGLRARCDGGGPILFPPQQVGVLLAFLALHADRLHTRDGLASLLWPDVEAESSRPNLRQQVYALRKQLAAVNCPESAIVTTRTTIRLNLDMVTTDVARFEQLIASAGVEQEPASRLTHLREAVELYRGELLPGFYQDSISAERIRLALEYRDALLRLADTSAGAGDLPAGIQAAKRAVAEDPLHEESHRLLMRLYATAGMDTSAVRQYQELERILDKELNSRPSAPTNELLADLRRSNHDSGAGVSSVPPHQTTTSQDLAFEVLPTRDVAPIASVEGSSTSQPRAPARRRYALGAGASVLLILLLAVWSMRHSSHTSIGSTHPAVAARQHQAAGPPRPADPVMNEVAWVARYASKPGDKDSEADSIVVDPDSHILVTGQTQTRDHDTDILTVSYDEKGHELWQARYNGQGNDVDRGMFVMWCPDNTTLVVGESDNGHGNDSTRLSGLDIVLLKYDQWGNPSKTWRDVGWGPGVRRYNGRANGEDTPTSVLVDLQGNTFVLGTSWGAGRIPGKDIVLLKYAPDGRLEWEYRFDGGHGDDIAAALAIDRDGDLLVAGTVRTEPATGPETDMLILRVNGQGKKVWERVWGAGNRADDSANAIHIDEGGNIQVIGEGRGLPGTPNANTVGLMQLVLNSRGKLLWCRGATNETDNLHFVKHVLFGGGGFSVVSGFVQLPDRGVLIRTVMRDNQGLTRWTSTTWPCENGDGPYGLGWGQGGHVLVGATAHFPKSGQDMVVEEYEPGGHPLSFRAFDCGRGVDLCRAIYTMNGLALLAGQSQSGASKVFTVVRFR